MKRNRTKFFDQVRAGGVICAMAAGVGAGCGPRESGWARVEQTGGVRVGYAVEAPYAFLDETGRVTGEGPELARRVSERLGWGEPEWVLTDFAGLEAGLEAGRFEVVAAGMFITPERQERLRFARPTARVKQGLLVGAGNPLGLQGYGEAIERDGVRLAVLGGSVEEALLMALGGKEGQRVVTPDVGSALALLAAGRVDGVALSEPTVRWEAKQSGGAFEVVEGIEGEEAEVGMAFKKGEKRLWRVWDAALGEILGTEVHREIERRFGFGGNEAGRGAR